MILQHFTFVIRFIYKGTVYKSVGTLFVAFRNGGIDMRRFTYTASVFLLAVCAVLLWGGTGEAEAKTKSKKGLAYFNEPAIGFAVEKYDKNKDGKFSEKELAKITKIYIDAEQREIDLKELKYLKNLKSFVIFDVEGYPIRRTKHASALYKLKKIKKIHIDDCDLSKGFKTAQWKNLETLEVRNCKIKKLSLKKNKKLEHLACDENPISTINVAKNKKLKSFSCGSTKLKKLDLSKNKKLTELSLNLVRDVEIRNVKLYQNGSKLEKLAFSWTQEREEIDLTGWNLSALKEITCTGIGADEDDVPWGPTNLKKVIVGNAPQLETAYFAVPTLEYVQILNSLKIKKLWYEGKEIKKITLSAFPPKSYSSVYPEDKVEIIK